MTTQPNVKTNWLDQEFADGYRDGRDRNAPDPSGNRSEAYRHSFAVGRAELAGAPIPAAVSRERAAAIRNRTTP
jgi:hypothetical protein